MPSTVADATAADVAAPLRAVGVPCEGMSVLRTDGSAVSDAVVMTAADRAALEAEVQELETVARAEIAERIRIAREWGDLKENAEYHDAKNSQALLEARIQRLRDRLLRAEVVEVEAGASAVGLGNTVGLTDTRTGKALRYTLVSSLDADAAVGRLSVESPVAQALLGSAVGKEVRIPTPKGERILKVVSID
jgi:transcription elongation factor GreA